MSPSKWTEWRKHNRSLLKTLLWVTRERKKSLDVIIVSGGLVSADPRYDLRGAQQPAFEYFFLFNALLWMKCWGSYLRGKWASSLKSLLIPKCTQDTWWKAECNNMCVLGMGISQVIWKAKSRGVGTKLQVHLRFDEWDFNQTES